MKKTKSNINKSFYRHVAQTSESPLGIEIESAEGCYLISADGEKYVDLISGIAVSSLGHRHPAVVSAIEKQIRKHLHVMVYGEFIQKPQSELAELLCSRLPASLDRVYFVNSGTEAIEGALKLAKKSTGRHKLVSFNNSYHGDTHGSLSVTGRDIYRDPYEPLLPDVRFFDFNSDDCLDAIDEQTAAVILEPIQGEGGIIPAHKEWLMKIRNKCDETGTRLIFDEIQTGFYRTGTLFAYEYYNVIPDILCIAKAMGGGMPIGAFVSSSELFETFKADPPLSHVTTFGGHPVSCAAAHANLKTLLNGDFPEKAFQIAKMACEMLKGDGIVEVRGRGAMLGLQLESSELAANVVKDCLKQGIIVGWTLHSNSLIRIAPPLIMSGELLGSCFDTIMKSIRKYR